MYLFFVMKTRFLSVNFFNITSLLIHRKPNYRRTVYFNPAPFFNDFDNRRM